MKLGKLTLGIASLAASILIALIQKYYDDESIGLRKS